MANNNENTVKYNQQASLPVYLLADVIDFFATKNVTSNYTWLEENRNLVSDHKCIVLTVTRTVIMKQQSPVLTNRITDCDGFVKDLEQKMKPQVSMKASLMEDQNNFLLVCNTPLLKPKIYGFSYIR